MRCMAFVEVSCSQLNGGRAHAHQHIFCLRITGRCQGHRHGYSHDKQSIFLSTRYDLFYNPLFLFISFNPGILRGIVGTLIKFYGALFSPPLPVKSNNKCFPYIQTANVIYVILYCNVIYCLDWCMNIIEDTFKGVKITPYHYLETLSYNYSSRQHF